MDGPIVKVIATYREANELLSAKNIWHDLRLQFWRSEVKNRRQADDTAAVDAVSVPSCATPNNLLRNNQLDGEFINVWIGT